MDFVGPTWRVHEFAALTGVTVKALHHYDRLNLLKPRRTASGYRIYCEGDLARLEQIVALKALGLPLKEIRRLLDRDLLTLPDALRMQRAVLEEKRRLLDRAIAAIVETENAIGSGQPASAALLKKLIEAIGMQTENTHEFMRNYYRAEGWAGFEARHRDWPSRAWRELFRDVQNALGEDPSSRTAQSLARRWRELRVTDSGGDYLVHAGLLKAWNDRQYWPEEVQRRFAEFDLDGISSFIARAFAAGRSARFDEIAPAGELASFPPEEKERFALATVDLYFRIAASVDADPRGEAGQALAARWLELIESRTGGHAAVKSSPEWHESYLRWMDKWPAAIHRKLQEIDQRKIGEFILSAMAYRAV